MILCNHCDKAITVNYCTILKKRASLHKDSVAYMGDDFKILLCEKLRKSFIIPKAEMFIKRGCFWRVPRCVIIQSDVSLTAIKTPINKTWQFLERNAEVKKLKKGNSYNIFVKLLRTKVKSSQKSILWHKSGSSVWSQFWRKRVLKCGQPEGIVVFVVLSVCDLQKSCQGSHLITFPFR